MPLSVTQSKMILLDTIKIQNQYINQYNCTWSFCRNIKLARHQNNGFINIIIDAQMANEHVWLNFTTVKKFTTLDHDGNKDILFEIH
jgi:hypothetical protein